MPASSPRPIPDDLGDEGLRYALDQMENYELLWHAKSLDLKATSKSKHDDLVAELLGYPGRASLLEQLNRSRPWHRRHLGLLAAIGLVGVVITAISLTFQLKDNSNAEVLQRLDDVRAELLKRESENIANEWSADASDLEVREELRRLLWQVEEARSDDDRVTLGHAALALSEGRTQKALTLVPLAETTADTQKALEEVEQTKKKVDRAVGKNWIRGLAQARRKEWEQAAAHFENILKLRSGDAQARLAAAACLLKVKRYAGAIEHFDGVISEQGRSLDGRRGAPATLEEHARLSWALVARGISYGRLDDPQKEVADYTALIDMPDAQVEPRTWALINRGVTYHSLGQAEKAMADYTTVIDMPDAQALPRAMALIHRGITYRSLGQAEKAMADYTTVIDTPEAHAVPWAWAVVFRGTAYGHLGQVEKEIADYTIVIDTPEAHAVPWAWAVVSRGTAYGHLGQVEKEIADYTSVIDFADAPAVSRATALYSRGLKYNQLDEPHKAIADCTAVLDMPDAPTEQRAMALVLRGATYGQLNRLEKAVADCTAVLDMPDAPAEQRGGAMYNRGVTYGRLGEPRRAIADFTAVVGMPDTLAEQRAMALINRGVAYGQLDETDKGIADIRSVLVLEGTPNHLRQHANELLKRLGTHP